MANSIDLSVLAARLRARRTELGLTQEALAERAEVNQSTVSLLERGEQTPTLTSVIALTKSLDVSLDWLLGMSDDVKHAGGDQGLDEEERQTLAILRSVDRPLRSALIELLRMVVAFKRL
ncbi:MAG: helix-turn-helix transcriptional regulator [Chloroflexi bacterium]|nr:helix-turn-helix transcriptional regulator [Chloroflexota bacterium]